MKIKLKASILTALVYGLFSLTGCGSEASISKLNGLGLSGRADDRGAARHGENENEQEHETEHGPEREGQDDHGRHGGQGTEDSTVSSRSRIQSPGDQSSQIGATIELTIQKTRPNDDDVYTFSATGLPAGLSIDPVSGEISGVVSAAAGVYAVTVQAMKPSGRGTHVDRYTVNFNWTIVQ